MIAVVKEMISETNGKIRESEAVGEVIGIIAEAGTHVDGLMSAGETRTGEVTVGILTAETEHWNTLQLRKWTGKVSSEMAEA